MDILTLLVMVAVAGAIASLVAGVSAMACAGEVGHRDSAHWMVARMEFQAAAILLILLAYYLR